jgi:cytochrome b
MTPADPFADAERPARVTVWPLWLRLGHWLLAGSVILAFATHEGDEGLHQALGYVALAAAALRVVMGWATRLPQARFDHFLRAPAATLAYARQVLSGRAPRFVGHNPLGGWMMAALLANALACGVTGWLFTTDRFYGLEWLEELHGLLGHAFLPLLALHVAGAIHASRQHRENLVAAMLHGRKRPAGPGDVD